MTSRSWWTPPLAGYLVAVAAIATALLARLILRAVVGGQAPFFPFILAVLVAAWYGGLKPGLLATGLGAVLGFCLYVPPEAPRVGSPGVAFITPLFVVIGAFASWLYGALHAARRRLEEEHRRLEDVQAQVRRLNGELLDADRRKDEFLATLAHELRNPLAPIRNAVELLRLADAQADLREQARSMIERQLGAMVRLIDDLLDISRISRGKLQLRKERVELASVIRSAVEAARPVVQAQGHELTLTVPSQPVYLDADPIRLAQVFSNLLTNAAKYTEKGGHIWLTADKENGQVAVSVRDTGIGIAAEHLPHLFEMFAQVTSALPRSQGGLGVGLALVRGLAELHGGRVEARSDGPGRGSEFIVHLPAAEAPVEAPPQAGGAGADVRNGRRFRILVVDDNRDAADSLALMLRVRGHDIQTAYDGLEAVQTAATFRPAIVLLDLGMPKMNGYAAARHIREQPWGGNVTLIALTGWGQEEDKRRAREAGFDQHLTKPVDLAVLEKMLASCADLSQ